MSELCRTCLIELRDTTYIMLNAKDVKAETVQAQLLACVPELQLNLVTDPVICRNCVTILELAYTFRTRCQLMEKRIQRCIRSVNLNGRRVKLVELFSLSMQSNTESYSAVSSAEMRDLGAVSSNNTVTSEHFLAEPQIPSLDVEDNIDEQERSNDYVASTADEDYQVVSMVDTEDGNELQDMAVNGEALMELTMQSVEFTDSTSLLTCTDITTETPQDLHNTDHDDIVKVEHDTALIIKTEECEELNQEQKYGNNEFERNSDYVTVKLSEVSNLIDDVKKEIEGMEDDDPYDAEENYSLDSHHEFPVPDEHCHENYAGDASVDTNKQHKSNKECSVRLVRLDISNYINLTNGLGAFQQKERPENLSLKLNDRRDSKAGKQNDIEASSTLKLKSDKAYNSSVKTTTSFQCYKCDFSTKLKHSLVRHMLVHSNEKPFKCNLCEYSTKTKRLLMFHSRTHGSEKPYSCNVCDYKATNKQTLSRHAHKHSENKPFCCNICKFTFAQRYNYVKHMRTHSGEKPFRCKICEYRAADKSNLLRHVRSHAGEKRFRCNICNRTMAQKSALEKHIATHSTDKPFSCNFCSYKSKYKNNLYQHVRRHTLEKTFRCTSCEYSAAQKLHLEIHMRIHTGEKPYHCDFCSYKTTQKGSLTMHIKKHKGENQYSCKLCEFKTAYTGALKAHLKLHNGENLPFSCEVCEFKAAKESSVLQHMNIHAIEKPFPCKNCRYSTRRKENLLRHISKNHKNESSQVE